MDAVNLATPSEGHEAEAVRCLDAGKHTLIETPVTMRLPAQSAWWPPVSAAAGFMG